MVKTRSRYQQPNRITILGDGGLKASDGQGWLASKCNRGPGNRSKTRGVIAGLAPAISIGMAQRQIIEMAGTSPAMTKWGCHDFCPSYRSRF